MSNAAVESATRAALATGLATHNVPWTQTGPGDYDPATGDSGADVVQNVDVLLYNEKSTQDDEAGLSTTIEGIVILSDLTHPVKRSDSFLYDGKNYNIDTTEPDPTKTIVEFKASV